MKIYFLVTWIAIGLILASCTKPIPSCLDCEFDCISEFTDEVITIDNCLDNYECSFEMIPDTKIMYTEMNGKTSSNNSFVIELVYRTEGSASIADDEFTNKVAIEIPNDVTSFSVSDSELESLKASLQISCFCSHVEWRPITNGCLQGEKKDGKWYVQAALTIDYYDSGNLQSILFDFQVQ